MHEIIADRDGDADGGDNIDERRPKTGDLATDASEAGERPFRLRPINVFELARRVYSSRKSWPRRHRPT